MRRSALEVTSTLLVCLVIWVWRRPEQLTRPYVWDEEAYILARWLADGPWLAAFHPQQGYFLMPASPLISLAAAISFAHLAAIEYVFATGVLVVTVLLLVVPESSYGSRTTRAAMALAMLLVPVNPETFGVLLYSIWWATLWPLIVLGWRRPILWARIPALLIGALSTPVGGVVLVWFAWRFLRQRRASDAVSALVLLAGLVAQLIAVHASTRASGLSAGPAHVAYQLLNAAGDYVVRGFVVPGQSHLFESFVGLVLLACLGLWGALSWRQGRSELVQTLGSAVAYAVFCAVAVPLLIDPVAVGRYFFLTFVALSWALIQALRPTALAGLPVSASLQQVPRVVCAAVVVLSLVGLNQTFARAEPTRVARLSWPSEVERCAQSQRDVVRMRIYFDGSLSLWPPLRVASRDCRKLAGG